jgi:hypothetical protein
LRTNGRGINKAKDKSKLGYIVKKPIDKEPILVPKGRDKSQARNKNSIFRLWVNILIINRLIF